MNPWIKYPAEVLVRAFDFTDALAPGDAIVGAQAAMKSGDVTVSRITYAGAIVTFWLAGGSSPSNQVLAVRVTTAAGEVLEEDIGLLVRG